MASDPGRCILHLDLDAFFAAVEQRDKPSLRGRPVVVGGLGARGVVSTASYEARVFGARSAMPMSEARRRCPAGTAFLSGRYEAYRTTSRVVMEILRSRSPLVEQVSVDEAYVDLAAAEDPPGWEEGRLEAWCSDLLAQIQDATGGLTASVGVATSKMMAKLASEMDKPAGTTVVRPGEELGVLHPLPVRAVAGVGPATAARLRTFGVETVGDLARVSESDLVAIFGTAQGTSLHRLARAQDERPVVVEREAKSISSEETFETDVTDRAVLESELARLAEGLSRRLTGASLFARTITVKARHHDFSTVTRSASLPFATGDPAVILREGLHLLGGLDVSQGLRLLGLGVSGLTAHAQEELALDGVLLHPEVLPELPDVVSVGPGTGSVPGLLERREPALAGRRPGGWSTGQDVAHEQHGAGWVWGSGRGRVTVRFEGPGTPPGPVRTFAADDPELSPAPPPAW
ncbi:DNA polymerase IV [Ornithinimicrobium humiphilum]|uniref:DNA polymerase IV n=1 Tax=Ornithinimicrobium humiphilum TaxID=125288 RepID=A0A543KPB9_9MICO|nr:DNA polymerase IV [Ornithinimicrobium humiphilum]TQM96916.1 DNA polymerase-4 [Ornithinimicrobium humiphilum]